jgi:translation initiation factor IF-1
MPRGDHLEMEGKVLDAMGGGQYKLLVDPTPGCYNYSTEVRAQLSGRMKRHHIRVLPGDWIRVSVSPYDLTHGLIVYRHKRDPSRGAP